MDENTDFSKAFEQLQQMLSSDEGQSQIQDILGMLTQSSDANPTPAPEPVSSDMGLDLNSIAKISGIIQALNSQNSNANTAFLNSLKPFLKESRRQKLDQATKILKFASVFKVIKENNEGGV